MIYRYKGYFNCESRCELRFFTGPIGEAVVVATKLSDNPGTSITNMAEDLATLVCREFGLEPEALLWIEHYPDRRQLRRNGSPDPTGTSGEESFDLVSFHYNGQQFSKPKWRRASLPEVRLLTGGTLPEKAVRKEP